MARDTTPRTVSGEVLPRERGDLISQSERQLPYAQPAQMLEHMGGFLHRWSMRGKAAAAVDLSRQFERLYQSYVSLHETMSRLEYARIDHARAINELRHLDDILHEDNRRRQASYAMAAQRDEIAQLQLQQQINDLKRKMAVGERRAAQETEDSEVPVSPSEQLRKAAAQRRELRETVEALIGDIRRSAGTQPLSPELEEDIQRIRDDADRLLLYAANERGT